LFHIRPLYLLNPLMAFGPFQQSHVFYCNTEKVTTSPE
jgi:hypothetical protein